MKKTRRWIVISIIPWAAIMTMTPAMDGASDTVSDVFLTVVSTYIFVAFLAAVVAPIYFMFRWTTAYNLANFGHKSKVEWERAREGEAFDALNDADDPDDSDGSK